jgi:hypothetical protein
MTSRNYERFGCGQTHLAVPASKENHVEQEIIQAWHALLEEMRRTSVHAALSAVRVKEKYALGRKE